MYTRTSESCSPGSLGASVTAAIFAHAEEHQLGDVLADAVEACATRSVPAGKAGFFRRIVGPTPEEVRTVALLTERLLVIAISPASGGTQVMSARLEDISVGAPGEPLGVTGEQRKRMSAELAGEGGASVTGRWSGHAGTHSATSYFLGLDRGAGARFHQALTDRVAAAKRR